MRERKENDMTLKGLRKLRETEGSSTELDFEILVHEIKLSENIEEIAKLRASLERMLDYIKK